MNWTSSLLAHVRSSYIYSRCRSYKHKLKRRRFGRTDSLTEEDVHRILTEDLGVRSGSSIFVHCGFGYLNADFPPSRLLEMLREIVGGKGNILMPFYPPGLSIHWARAGRCFDLTQTESSTGVLSHLFAYTNDVLLSTHPIKSVAAWGANASELVAEHSKSLYPFDQHSPYYKLAQISGSLSIGLGLRHCSMFHCAEDLYEPDKSYLYSTSAFELSVRTRHGSDITVRTFVHHGQESLSDSWDYFDEYLPSLPTVVRYNGSVCYSINNQEMMSQVGTLLSQGTNRRKARSRQP